MFACRASIKCEQMEYIFPGSHLITCSHVYFQLKIFFEMCKCDFHIIAPTHTTINLFRSATRFLFDQNIGTFYRLTFIFWIIFFFLQNPLQHYATHLIRLTSIYHSISLLRAIVFHSESNGEGR
jgi:hypothetical protein